MNELKEIEFNEEVVNKFIDIDGSLRDIYVNNTDINDWFKLYESLLNSDYSLSYSENQKVHSLPDNVNDVFNNRESSHILRVQEENVIFNTHFFIKEQIEFDLNPRDFVAINQSKILIDFMHYVSDVLEKEVIMTPENFEEHILIKVSPKSRNIFIKQNEV